MTPRAMTPLTTARLSFDKGPAQPPSHPARWPELARLHAGTPTTAFRPHAPRLQAPDCREVLEIAGLRVEVAETKGFRREQEDAFFVCPLSPEHRANPRQALLDAFASTHRVTRFNSCGSTCTVAVVEADRKLTLAHLGDSPALLFVLDGLQGDVYYKSLINSHTAHDEFERRRVEACWTVECLRLQDSLAADKNLARKWRDIPDVTGRGRIHIPNGGSLSVTRAFGDRDYDWALGRQPDITEISLDRLLPDLNHRDRIFLCVACDGLTEVPSRDPESAHLWLAAALRRTLEHQGDERLAERLVSHAYQRSADNITAMVTEIPAELTPGEGAVVMGVADGHGGKQTAWQVASHMHRMLGGESA